jgi:hypothetical protein
MEIEWEGRMREVDANAVDIKQAFVIKESTKDDAYPGGRSLSAWQQGLNEVDPACVRAFYWLMLQQEGTEVPIAGLNFPVIKFSNAVMTAVVAEQKAEAKEKAAADAEAAAAAVPTSAPSPERASPPATTPAAAAAAPGTS